MLHTHKKGRQTHRNKTDCLIQRFIYVSLTDLDIFTMKLKLITSPGSYWNFFCSVPLLNKETKEKRHVLGDKYLHFQCFFRLKCKILFLFKGTRILEMSLKNRKTSISAFVGSNLLITGWFTSIILHLRGLSHILKYGEPVRFE